MHFKSLRAKLLIGVIGKLVLLGGLLIIFISTTVSKKIETELQQRAVILADDIVRESIEDLLTENIFNIQLNIHKHKENVEWVEYVFVINSDGNVVAHTFQEIFPIDLMGINAIMPDQKYNVQHITTGKDKVFDLAMPILKGELGIVRLGISESSISEGISNITQMILYIVIGVLILGGGIAIILAASITKPISELTLGAERIGSGDLNYRVDIKSKDEIGQLASAFNRMSEDLRKTTVSRDELAKEVTERKEAVEALKISEKKYRNLVDNSIAGVFQSNLEGKIFFVNTALATMFEFESPEEMMSRSILSLFYNSADRNMLLDELQSTGIVNNFEIEALTKTGILKYILISATLEEDMISGMIMDITERKKAETALQKSKQIIMIGELTTGLADDIRNPLAGIKASLHLINDEHDLSDENRAIVFKSIAEIKRIESLVRSLLNFARPPKPRLSAVNINNIVDSTLTLSLTHPSVDSDNSKMIDFLKDYDQKLPDTMIDPFHLQQAFLNLIFNAIEAMSDGGSINAKTTYEKKANSIRIEISDTGRGIDSDQIEKIFQPFYTTKPKGIGLGLAITKRLIEENGGNICVEANPERGVTFIIYLPVKQEDISLSI